LLIDDHSKWNARYMQLAKEIAQWSKDPSTKVGSVAIGSKGQVLSQGYNGFPRGIHDYPERLLDRPLKYSYTIHAEMNVIYNATYSGVSLDGAKLYVYGLPVCNECAKGIVQVGIKEVYISKESIEISQHWTELWAKSVDMFEEADLKVYVI
jgi:dCMP deaminase